MTKEIEIIDLDSDHDSSDDKIKDKTCDSNCVNFKCTSGNNTTPTPLLSCSFTIALDTTLYNERMRPAVQCDSTKHTMLVELSDTDESDRESMMEKDKCSPKEAMLVDFKTEVKGTQKFDLKYKVKQFDEILKAQQYEINDTDRIVKNSLNAQKLVTQIRVIPDTHFDFKPNADSKLKIVHEVKVENNDSHLRGEEHFRVGTHVEAAYDDTESKTYYRGIIAEPPKSTNQYRYLIFFNHGPAQYVLPQGVNKVRNSSKYTWNDEPLEFRIFVKNYLESYPEWPMEKFEQGQIVETEWNGMWYKARVLKIDASLVQVQYDEDYTTEWIYRGSIRLKPLGAQSTKTDFQQQDKKSSHSHETSVLERTEVITSNNRSLAKYMSNVTEELDANHNEQSTANNEPPKVVSPQSSSRAVARKSTAKKQTIPETSSKFDSYVETASNCSTVYYEVKNKIQAKKFVPHNCSPDCVSNVTPDDLHGYSPLSIPLLCGWNRQLCKFSTGKKVILYQAPCGVRLRDMDEVHRYLKITDCPMTVDLFEFEHWVRCLAEYKVEQCFVNIQDLSYGNENMPIQCVNEIDHAHPETFEYTTQRKPTEDVHIDLDPEFLCGCDCEDDCADKEKCQCWRQTNVGATLGGRVPNAAVGYHYKRLREAVPTGVYECNSKCKCSAKKCLNRVVQQPLSLRLQIFKTANRGWGLRCLNDIPAGTFICAYAGSLLSEQEANRSGQNYGDEYLAELDYVEVVESIKEGYESEAIDPETGLALGNDSNFERDFLAMGEPLTQSPPRKRRKDEEAIEKDEDIERGASKSVRQLFGEDESVYVMDAKAAGNVGRFLNHSCDPNVFVQNVFVDTHDVRFPWVAFFALKYIRLGQELTWNYNYEIGSIPGKVIVCKCGASNCRGRLL